MYVRAFARVCLLFICFSICLCFDYSVMDYDDLSFYFYVLSSMKTSTETLRYDLKALNSTDKIDLDH